MTVLGALLRTQLDNPSVPLSDPNLAEWLTGTRSEAGVRVSEHRVLGLPAYYRAIATAAGTLASIPMHVYRNGTRERISQRTVLDLANPRHTPLEYWFTTYAHAFAWGNSYSRKLRDGAGVVRQVWPIHPSRVTVEEIDPSPSNPEGKLFRVVDRMGVEHTYSTQDIFHLPYMSWDGVTGVRPLHLFRQALGISIAADDSAAKMFGNGLRASGYITSDKNLEESIANRLRARWRAKAHGMDNVGDIAILDNGAKFEALAIPPQDAQLLESRKWSVVEIARMVGVPPHLVGDVERSTSWGTGIEQQVLGWVKFGLQTWITLAEQKVTRELLPGGATAGSWYAKAQLNGLMRGDAKTRAAFYHAGILDGWLNRNEARDLEDLERAEGLDEFLVPSNLTLISVDGQLVPLSANGQQDAETLIDDPANDPTTDGAAA